MSDPYVNESPANAGVTRTVGAVLPTMPAVSQRTEIATEPEPGTVAFVVLVER